MPGKGDPIIRSELERGDVAIDIGANPKGDDVTGLMRDQVGSDGLIIAFDPFPIDGFHGMETEYENVVCIPEAVTNERVSLEETSRNVGSSTEEHGDRTYEGGIPLDIVSKADFVKVDVEGLEYDVLRSGSRLLDRHHPELLIEVHKWKERQDGWTRAMISLLGDLDYDIYSVTNGGRVTSTDDLWDSSADKIFCESRPKPQKELVHEREWDWLLVLDSCRYDAFEALYENYLEGELQKVRTPLDKPTDGWVSNVWPDKSELTYVSAHPALSSNESNRTDPINKNGHERTSSEQDTVPIDRFDEAVEVWDFGYDEEIESVNPEAVNDALREVPPPAVGHYSQPQFPWVRGSEWSDKNDVEVRGNPRTEMSAEGPTSEPRFSRRRVRKMIVEGV